MAEQPFQLTSEDSPRMLTMAEYAARHGYESTFDIIEHLTFEDVMEALCDADCRVEHDGVCSHGHPSPLRHMGFV